LRRMETREVAVASLLGALSAMFEIVPGPPFDIPFPLLPNAKISWDLTGVPMMVSLLLFNPLCGVYTCIIGCSIIFLRGNLFGGIFKLIAELSTIVGFAAFRRNIIVDTVKAVLSRVAVMTVANYCLLPLFYSTPEEVVVGILGPIAIFNVTQALINIIPAYMIYLRARKSIIEHLDKKIMNRAGTIQRE